MGYVLENAPVAALVYASGPLTKLDELPPLIVAEEFKVSMLALLVVKLPFVSVSAPLTVVFPPSVIPFELLIVRLLRVEVNSPLVVCKLVPLYKSVEVAPYVTVLPPRFNVPLFIVSVPLTVRFEVSKKSRPVTPPPFKIKLSRATGLLTAIV